MSEAEEFRRLEREFTEEGYAAFYRQNETRGAPAPPRSWREWEEDGWWDVPENWPVAEAILRSERGEDLVNRRLRCPRSPLVPGHQTLQYFLLRRIWKDKSTTVARISALGELVSCTVGVAGMEALQDRALLVFCKHWRMLEIGELTEVAAEVYLELCALHPKLAPDKPAYPKFLEGMDIGCLD